MPSLGPWNTEVWLVWVCPVNQSFHSFLYLFIGFHSFKPCLLQNLKSKERFVPLDSGCYRQGSAMDSGHTLGGIAIWLVLEFSSPQMDAPGPTSYPCHIPFPLPPPPTLSNCCACQSRWCQDRPWHGQAEGEDSPHPLLRRMECCKMGR